MMLLVINLKSLNTFFIENLGGAQLKRLFLRIDFAFSRYTVYQILDKVKFKLNQNVTRYKAKLKSLPFFRSREVGGAIEPTPSIEFDADYYDVIMCIPFTGRYEILEFVLDEFFQSGDSNNKVGVCLVGSSDGDDAFASKMHEKYGNLSYQNCPNYPLGRKAQLSMDLTRLVDCAAILMNGSDDVVSSSYVKSCVDYIKLGSVDFIAPIVWYTYNAAPESTTYGSIWRTHYIGTFAGCSLGAGRAYSKAFLEKIDYDIFASGKDIHLDTKMERMAASDSIKTVHPCREDGPIVSIKGDWDKLNDIEELLDNCPTVCFADVEFESSKDLNIVREIKSNFSGITSEENTTHE